MVVGCKSVGQGTGECSPLELVGYTSVDGSPLEVFQKAPSEVWHYACFWKILVGKHNQG